MNPGPAEPPPFVAAPPAAGWGWKKFLLVSLLAIVVHLAFVFLLGAKKQILPRAVKNVPVFHLADNAGELVRLTDPTLFALPHTEDFPASVQVGTPTVTVAEFRRPETLPFLTNNPARLGAMFNVFMQTNQTERTTLKFKPEPELAAPAINLEPVLPQNSSWLLAGALAGRRVLNDISVPPPAVNDVLAPSRVQLLVSPDGNIVSAVLLEASGLDAADQSALALARTLRFAPADKLAFGEIIFTWHTVPATAP
jgi:TonB family protein